MLLFLLKHRKIERKTFPSAKFPCKTLLMSYFLLPWTSLSIIKAIPIQCFRDREKSIEKNQSIGNQILGQLLHPFLWLMFILYRKWNFFSFLVARKKNNQKRFLSLFCTFVVHSFSCFHFGLNDIIRYQNIYFK